MPDFSVHEVIDFERDWNGKSRGAKEESIRATFGMKPARYYYRLTRILQDETSLRAALEHDAATVNRLQRLRDRRAAARIARTVQPSEGATP